MLHELSWWYLVLDEMSGLNVGHGGDELETTAAGPESVVNLVELKWSIRKSIGVRSGGGFVRVGVCAV